MDGFEQQFRDQWGNRTEPEFRSGDWDNLNQRLHPEKGRRSPGWLFLLLPWIGIGGLLLWLNSLNHQIQTLQSTNHSPILLHDTLVQIQEFMTRDTVYIVRSSHQRDTLYILPSSLASTVEVPQATSSSMLNAAQETGHPGALGSDPSIESYPDQGILPVVGTDWGDLDALPPQMIGQIPSETSPYDLSPQIMAVDHQPKVFFLKKAIHAMEPSGVGVIAEGGGIYPVGKGITQPSGYSIGLRGILHYGSSWMLSAGGSVNHVSFELNRFDSTLGVPEVAPPSESFEFLAAEVIRPFITLDVQAKYSLSDHKRWSPFLETGLRAIMTQPYDVLYDFKNPATGVTWTYENSPKGEVQLPVQALMGAGLRYRLGSAWSIGVHGQYMFNLSRKNAVPNQLMVGGLLQYDF